MHSIPATSLNRSVRPGRALSGLLIAVLVLGFALTPLPARADSIADLQNQIAADQSKLAQIAARTNSIDSEMASVQTKITQLQAVITQLNANLVTVNGQLSHEQARLAELVKHEAEVTDQLHQTEKELARRQAIFNNDVRLLDKIRPTNELSILLGSSSFADFLDRMMSMNQLVHGDHEIAAQLKAERAKIAALRAQIDSQRKQEKGVVDAIHQQQQLLQQEYAVQTAASDQLWALKAQLGQTASGLAGQSSALKTQIQSDRAEIQSLLAFAQARVGSGGDLLAPEYLSSGWGAYYNQRDARWGNDYMGSSSYQVWEVGCLMTDVAMVYTHFGYGGVTPGSIAANPSNFTPDGLLYNSALNIPGHLADQRWGASAAWINSYLDSGGVVIVGMNIGGGTHFVTLTSRNGAYDYWMNDPWAPDAMNVSFNNSGDTGPIYEAIGYR